MNRGRTLSLPSGSHPVVIPASDSGRTVFALSQGNRIQFYGLNDFIPELLAGISIPDLNGASPIWTGAPLYTRSSSGGHLLVAVQYAKGGQATDSAILNIALKNFPEVTATSISLPDTARIVRMAAADDFVAAAGANGVLHTGLLDSGTFSSLALSAASPSGLVIADLDRDTIYDVVVTAERHLYFVKINKGMKTVTGVAQPSLAADISLPDETTGEPVAADIDRDGYPEVLQSTVSGIHAYRSGGVRVTGFPFALPPGDSEERIASAPLICDFDGNNNPDIAFATSNQRFIVLNSSGQSISGFPITIPGTVASSPLVFSRSSDNAVSLALVTTDGALFTRELTKILPANRRLWSMWRGGATLPPPSRTAPSPVW